uniref:Amino acid permease/ SLC12A domain-containing protein n=1 Tax=Arion vulgaris TaxID=1028688 RepID=A0A0B6ZXN1_9EUPU
MDERNGHSQLDCDNVDNTITKDSAVSEKLLLKENKQVETTLRRHLTLFNVLALLVSATGHIAVFITIGPVLAMSGSVVTTIILWCFGCFLVYTLALCFTEMDCLFQRAGGAYLYLTMTFGNLAGFLVVWGYIILISGPFNAFASRIAALYIIKAVTLNSECNIWWHEVAVHLLACWLLVNLAIMNCYYLKVLVKVQNILTACKMVAIVIIIAMGIYFLATDSSENFKDPLEGSYAEPGRVALAIIYVIFSIGGWQAVTTLTEEVKDPARTLPRAVHLTFVIVVFLFLMTYVSYMVVLEKQDIIQSRAIALLFCQRLWTPLVPVMSILVALACIGALSTSVMGHSRMIFAAARKGDLPSLLSTLHPTYRTPMMAIFTVTLYGIVMMFSGKMEKLMQFIGLYSLIMGLKVVVALLYLRWTKPKLARPYKVPLFFPLLQVITCISLLCLVIIQEPVWMSFGILIYLAGIPIYIIFVQWRHKPQTYIKLIGQVTGVIQKLFTLVPS